MPEKQHTTLKDLINSLMHEITKFDKGIKEHSTRVANLCVLFSKKLGCPAKEINQVYIAALLHDIGLIFIPKKIALKKKDLDESELGYIQKHPLISEKILSKYSVLKDILPIIRSHHEALDGSGYPDGLKGSDIPETAKMLSIVNCYDNFFTNSVVNQAMRTSYALEEIKKMGGEKLDKELTDKFISFMRENEQIPENQNVVQPKSSEDKISEGTVKEIVEKIINKFKKYDLDLPVLPAIVQDIQDVINSPSAGIDQLVAVIEKDAVISVRLIAVANSVLYRGTEKIINLKQAIPRIGAKETQSIVTTIASKGLYEVEDTIFKELMEKLWKHSLATAFCAKAIAEKLKLGDNEKYYFLGLIHDIGKVLILKSMGDLHQKYDTLDINKLLDEAKAAHTRFGSLILRKWGFSDEYARICLLHAGPNFKNSTDRDILIINLAGNIAKMAGYGVKSTPDDIHIPTLESRILLGIEPPEIDSIIEKVNAQMSELTDIFS